MPFVDMQPTDPNDPQRKFVMYKAPALSSGGGGSDSNDGLTPSTPLATFNGWWKKLFEYNINGCWPWLRCLDGEHTDSLDACNQPPGAPGWDTTNPGAGAGSFPVISSVNGPTNCIMKPQGGKPAFSAIYGANFVIDSYTGPLGFDCGQGACVAPGEYGVISGGFGLIKSCKYVVTAEGGKFIGDGHWRTAVGASIAGLWLASEDGVIKMTPNVNITFDGPVNFYGATAFVTNGGYCRVSGVTFVNPQNATGLKYVCQMGGGLHTGTGNPQAFMPGSIAGVTHQGGLPDGWAF